MFSSIAQLKAQDLSFKIVYIFGPSCSGKSTLSKELLKRLGDSWKYIDRDVLIEQGQCLEAKADMRLEEIINSSKNSLIIDAQVPWREKLKGELYFLVLPPLVLLLQRDAERTIVHKRNEKFAKVCREYVIETHTTLEKTAKSQFDYCFDSTQQVSVHDAVDKILTFVNKVNDVKHVPIGASPVR